MQRGSMTDREAYPTAWITLAVLVLLYLLWRFALGHPLSAAAGSGRHWACLLPGLRRDTGADGPSQGRVARLSGTTRRW